MVCTKSLNLCTTMEKKIFWMYSQELYKPYKKDIDNYALNKYWRFNIDKEAHKKNLKLVKIYCRCRKIDCHDSCEFYPEIICKDVRWFCFQVIMLQTENNIKMPFDILQSLLKVFSMFKIRIWYDERFVHEDVPDPVEIFYINFGKTIAWLLDNQSIEHLVTPFSKI